MIYSLIASPLYLIAALIWQTVLSGDMRFQGQGGLGLVFLMIVGLVCTIIRLLFAPIILVALTNRDI